MRDELTFNASDNEDTPESPILFPTYNIPVFKKAMKQKESAFQIQFCKR